MSAVASSQESFTLERLGGRPPARAAAIGKTYKTSPAPTAVSSSSGKSTRSKSRITRSDSGNRLSPEKNSIIVPDPSASSRTSPPNTNPPFTPSRHSSMSSSTSSHKRRRLMEVTNYATGGLLDSESEDVVQQPMPIKFNITDDDELSVDLSEEDDPEVIPAKKDRTFSLEKMGHDSKISLKPVTPLRLTLKLKDADSAPTRGTSVKPPSATSQNGDITPTISLDDDAATFPYKGSRLNGKPTATKPVDDEIAGTDYNRRAPRKKRKWLKKGEVDPDDPIAVARQKEKHSIIDEAVANLNAQEKNIRDGLHPQLIAMWKELDRRRNIQLKALAARYEAGRRDLDLMRNHAKKQATDNWNEIKETLVRTMSTELHRTISQLAAERVAAKHDPKAPNRRNGRGASAWDVQTSKLLSTDTLPTTSVDVDGYERIRKDLAPTPEAAAPNDIHWDYWKLGIRKEVVSSEPSTPVPPYRYGTPAKPEVPASKSTSKNLDPSAFMDEAGKRRYKRYRFSPPPPIPRPRTAAPRYTNLADAFLEEPSPLGPIPLDAKGEKQPAEQFYRKYIEEVAALDDDEPDTSEAKEAKAAKGAKEQRLNIKREPNTEGPKAAASVANAPVTTGTKTASGITPLPSKSFTT